MKTLLRTFAAFLFLVSFLTNAATLPTGFTETRIATGLDPTGVTVMADGRVLVTIKSGKILLIKNDAVLTTPLLTIPNVDNWNERGLLAVIQDPAFSSNGYIYVYYTYKNPTTNTSNNRVARFTVTGDVANVNTQLVLIDFDNLSTIGWHNGGGLAYGLDGKIYASTGENANAANAQSFNNLLGKVIRINPDGSIPTDNPFYASTTGKNRAIYALGLRNPFRMKLQPTTGKIYINEVGAGTWEEINEVKAGRNYGWSTIEGKITNQTPPANYEDPVYAYNHSNGTCSITGGTFYNPTTVQFPIQYANKYFFLDYCAGWIRYIDPANNYALSNFATGVDRPLDLAVNSAGSMYYIARGGLGGGSDADNTSSTEGELWKIDYTGSGVVNIGVDPLNKSVAVGASVTFAVSATGAAPLEYQWLRNGQVIQDAKGQTYNILSATLADNGAKFSVVVSNGSSTKTSKEATLTVFVNTAPVATITTPTANTTYEAGTTISFSGTGTDAEDGTLPASAFSWYVYFQHDTHYHPSMDAISGIKDGTFLIPDEGETSDTVWYRIYLTVTDALGTKNTVFRDIVPKKVNVTLDTDPTGLKLKLDGVSITTLYMFTGVVGLKRSLEADNIINSGGKIYSFLDWSNNGTALQTILTPKVSTIYTANYGVSKSDTLLAIADAYVKGGTNASITFGTTDATQLQTKTEVDPERIRQTYLRFDISKLTTVSGAKLRLFGKRNSLDNANIKVAVYGVQNQTWNENAITWNNKPTPQTTILAETEVNAEPTSVGQYYDWDVSEYVKAAKVSGATSISFYLANSSITAAYVFFNSKEATSNKPQLVITSPSSTLFVEQEAELQNFTKISPNPFLDQLLIQAQGSFEYSIFDMTGVLVENGKGQNSIQVAKKLGSGVYGIKIKTEKKEEFLKAIKQ